MCFARVLRQWMWWALGPCLLVLALTAHTHELPPTLAQSYHPGIDVQAYWVSEKYDGVRGIWDGQALRTRSGEVIAAPAWFTAGWPSVPMDGELWAGRGRFEQVQAAVAQAAPQDAPWRALRYMVFDLPGQAGGFGVRVYQHSPVFLLFGLRLHQLGTRAHCCRCQRLAFVVCFLARCHVNAPVKGG